jgi:polysaccharide chain length determinant protein (PEP-CTERM system associated)
LEEIVRRHEEAKQIAQISLRDLVAPIFRRRRLVAISFFGICSGVLVVTLLLPRQYQAQMKILVKRERIDPTITSDKTTVIEPRADVTEEQVQSEVELLQSRDLLEKVARECGLVQVNRASNDQELAVSLAVAVRNLQERLQVEPLKRTDLISVSYRSSDPVVAARVLNALANSYLEKHLAVHRLPGAFDFFQAQTERYRKELESSEEHLVNFDRDTGVVSPELEKDITLRKLSDFDAALRETQANITETTERIRSLEAQMSSTTPRMTTQERTSENPLLLQQLKSTLLTLQLKHTELITKFAINYPLVQEVEKQIKQTEAAITAAEQAPFHEQTTDNDPAYAWLREELAKNRAQLIALRARAGALAPVVEAYQAKTSKLNEKEATQQDLMRASKAAEGNYLLYLQRQEEARISDALDSNRIVNVAIAEPASVPALPMRSRWSMLLLGVLLATLVSVGAAFGADYVDPSFRTPQELHMVLQIPVLAAVPREVR